jgi:SP family arabinose:H+ symporter-like MFS transporter
MIGRLQLSKRFFIIFFAAVAALGGFLFGFDTAVISGTIGFVQQQFGLNAIQEGWFVSSALVGCLTGAMVAGNFSDIYGRRTMLLVAAALFMLSALGCMLSPDFNMLVIYRIVGGLGVGMASMLSPLYISEYSPSHLRGRMVALYQLAITIGILLAYFSNAGLLKLSVTATFANEEGMLNLVVGEEVWRGMFGAEMIPAGLFLLTLFMIPESPRWLVKQGKNTMALTALMKITDEPTARHEIHEISEVIGKKEVSLKVVFKPPLRTAMIIGILLAVMSQFSGINAIIYYGPRVMAEAGLAISEALGGQVTIGLVNVVFTFLAIATIDRFGRRPLLIFGVSGAALSLLMVGFYFLSGSTNALWLLIFIVLFIACFAFSFGPVVWVILSEIYPTRIRGRAMSVATFSLWLANTIVGQVVPWLLDNLGPTITFWMFALTCSPAIWIAWKILPETKGRSLEDIEKYWFDH